MRVEKRNEIQRLNGRLNVIMIVGLIIISLFVVRYASKQRKQRKKEQHTHSLLMEHTSVITQKKNEIEESINYARGLQNSILPPRTNLSNYFKHSFIYFEPKDVVSGDFYWMHETNGAFYCVVADCTGHGVPGAFMSVIGVDKLTQAIFERKMTEPNEILGFLNQKVGEALQQDVNSKHKDGMDIGLICFNKTKNTLKYAGANRPLIISRNTELLEFKPDKVAIGGYTSPNHVFNQQEIELKPADMIYMFTDGYADQFGGDKDKKYMLKKLKFDLLALSNESSFIQENNLKNNLNTWKGDAEQVDDILVLGIKYE